MKVAIPVNSLNIDSEIGNRFGNSQYILFYDLETDATEFIKNPLSPGQRGGGVWAAASIIGRGAKAVLTEYCNPAISSQFKANGIDILTGLHGTARQVIEIYRKEILAKNVLAEMRHSSSKDSTVDRKAILFALKSSARQFITLLPVLISVVLLIGLFDTLISEEVLKSVFKGNSVIDTFLGACLGSVFAGNPINSYIIGGELLEYGVSLFAITAFIVTWVTVGLVQLPAEVAAFGWRFAILRNGFSFFLAIPISIFTVVILNILYR